jgi:hypothetical protein
MMMAESRLTSTVSGRRPDAAIQFEQIRKWEAVTSTASLGGEASQKLNE